MSKYLEELEDLRRNSLTYPESEETSLACILKDELEALINSAKVMREALEKQEWDCSCNDPGTCYDPIKEAIAASNKALLG